MDEKEIQKKLYGSFYFEKQVLVTLKNGKAINATKVEFINNNIVILLLSADKYETLDIDDIEKVE